jgi:predicted PurR-regulated permease PerM
MLEARPPPVDRPRGPPVGEGASAWTVRALFVMALLYGLHIAALIIVPVVVATLLALLLSPLLRGLTRIRLPAPLAAGTIVLLFIGVLGSGCLALSSPAADWLEQMPRNFKRLEQKLKVVKAPMQEMSAATQQMEELASIDRASKTTQSVEIKEPDFLRFTLRSTQPALVSIAMTFVLLYFILASGSEIVRKLAAPRRGAWSRRRVITIVRAVEADISRYLVTVSIINAALGAIAAMMLHVFGMPNAMLWGVVIALLNYAPYVGAALATVLLAVVALLSLDSIAHALVVPATFVALAFVEGQLITPSVIGRRLSLSPLIVFCSVVVCGWLWGVVGALIAVPLLACSKIVCQHVPNWNRAATIMGR